MDLVATVMRRVKDPVAAHEQDVFPRCYFVTTRAFFWIEQSVRFGLVIKCIENPCHEDDRPNSFADEARNPTDDRKAKRMSDRSNGKGYQGSFVP